MTNYYLPDTWILRHLGSELSRRDERVNPAKSKAESFLFVGLENIESHTGRLVGVGAGVDAKSTKNIFYPGDILYGKLRPNLNKVHLAETTGLCSTDIWVLKPSALIDSAYATYFLRSNNVVSRTTALATGANLPRVSAAAFDTIPLPLPTLTEQRHIVSILNQAAALRRLRADTLAQSQDLVPALFRQMFGDMQTAPEQFEVVSFEKIVSETQLGLVRGANEMGDDLPYPYVRMDAILGDGSLDLRKIRMVDATDKEVRSYSLAKDDFLFNTRNSRELVGKTALFDGEGTYLYNNNIMRVRFDETVDPYYVNQYFQTVMAKRELEMRKSGTTSVVAIYWKNLKKLPVVRPSLLLQQEFGKKLKQIRAFKEKQTKSLREIEDLYYALLAQAFTGKLTETWREARADSLIEEAFERDTLLGLPRTFPTTTVKEFIVGTGSSYTRADGTHAIIWQAYRPAARRALRGDQLKVLALAEQTTEYFTATSLRQGTDLRPRVVEDSLALLDAMGLIRAAQVTVEPEKRPFLVTAYRLLRPEDLAGEGE